MSSAQPHEPGTPLHHHVSYLAIADLAAAAVRAERHVEARALLERALAHVGPAPGPRLEQLAARARALLAGPATAEHRVISSRVESFGKGGEQV